MIELQLTAYRIEFILPDYWARANFKPLGSMLSYLNDRTRSNVRFEEIELMPLSSDRQVGCIKQAKVTVEKKNLVLISVLEREEAQSIQVLQSKRPVIFYTGHFAIQGQLHANADARDDDLLDDARDYSALSEVTLFPLRQLGATGVSRKVPLLLINQQHIQTYHVHLPAISD
jgi:hypothetical protein